MSHFKTRKRDFKGIPLERLGDTVDSCLSDLKCGAGAD